MPGYSISSSKNFLSRRIFGRYIDLIDNEKINENTSTKNTSTKNTSTKNTSTKNNFEIIVLIEDQIYSLKIKKILRYQKEHLFHLI